MIERMMRPIYIGANAPREPAKYSPLVLTYDDPQGEDEESSLPHIGASKLPPGILPPGLPQVKEVQPAVTQVEQEAKKEHETKESEYSKLCYIFLLLLMFIHELKYM